VRSLPNRLLHHHPLLLLCSSLLLLLSWIFLSVQIISCSKQLLQLVVHEIVFPQSVYSPPIDSDRVSYAHFTTTLQSVQIWFQTAQHLMFLPYLLVQFFKIIDLGGVGIRTLWSFWFQTFAFFYISDQVLKPDENSDVVFEVRWWWCTRLQFLWARLLSSWLRFNNHHV
jgi:hypothetical protein